MKMHFFTVFLLLLSFANLTKAQPCLYFEAQFIGTISSARTVNINQGQYHCLVKVEFHQIRSSIVCPLDEMDVQDREIHGGNIRCEGVYEVGKDISGVIIKNQNKNLYFD